MGKIWTKDAEREQLRKIVALIEETDCGSYIRMSFSGIPELCERNITEDAANNMPDAVAYREKQIAELQNQRNEAVNNAIEKIHLLEHENSALEDNLKRTADQLDQYKAIVHGQSEKIGQLSEELCEAANTLDIRTKMLAEKDAEIMRLKAELYDYMKGAKNNE